MSAENIRIEYLTGSIPFIEPKYWIEAKRDLLGRPKEWWLMCDQGCNIGGFETSQEAWLCARRAGIKCQLPEH